MSAPCLVFNIVTDTHMDMGSDTNIRQTKESLANLLALNEKVRSNAVIHLGDLLSTNRNSQSNDTIYKEMSEYIASLYESGVEVMMTIGNHDGDGVATYKPNRWFAVSGRLSADYVDRAQPYLNGDSVKVFPAYFYKDYPDMSVRCIFLSTPCHDEKYTYSLSPKELKWFAEEALNVEAGTQVLIFAHEAPFDTDISSNTSQYETLRDICAAFHNKTTYTKTSGTAISADYSSKTGAEIRAYFCGHQHFDNVAAPGWTYSGYDNQGNAHEYENEFSFPIVNIGANLLTSGFPNTYGGTIPSRTDKTVTQDLWDTLVYRPDVSKIYLVRFGAGSDREISI